ncbi:MAG: hypothetical protein ACLPSW_01535 [Roseiarcus sp.]
MERFIANPTASPPQFRISKPGKSVTSIDLDDYLINEQFSTVSAIAVLNIVSVPQVATGEFIYTYPHGLPFIPLVLPMVSFFETSGSVGGGGGTINVFATVSGTAPQNNVCVYADLVNVYYNLLISGAAAPPAPYLPSLPVVVAIFDLAVQ